MKILPGQDDINPDIPNISDRTSLCRAVQYGHEGVVKILNYSGGARLTSTRRVSCGGRHSVMLVTVGIREWRRTARTR